MVLRILLVRHGFLYVIGGYALVKQEMAPFSREVKYQNSSKSHLFQKLKNTLIFR